MTRLRATAVFEGKDAAWIRCIVLLLVAVVTYFQTWADLWPLWENKNATYTHGVLVALIAVWLVWRTRTVLSGVPVASNLLVLPVVVLLSAVWLLVAAANVLVGHSMLWPVLALFFLWAGTGWRVASKFIFPLGFLYFAIPFWDFLEPALQAIASNIVGLLIGIAGTQASVDGPYIMLPSSTIFIALTCSGAHFLSVSLAMGALAGEIRGDSTRTRLVIMALAGLLSVLFNSLRILLIVLAHLHPTLRAGFETIGHLTFGWWVFALDIIVFFLALRLVPASKPPAPATLAGTTLKPLANSRHGFVLAMAAALLLPVVSWAARHSSSYPKPVAAPPDIAGAAGPISPDSRWQPGYKGAALEHRVAYILPDGRVIELYHNVYHRQSQGNELIADGAPLFDHAFFTMRTSNAVQLKRTGAQPVDAYHMEMRDKSGRSWAALYTYVLDGKSMTDANRVQLLAAWRSLFGAPTAGVFAVATPCVQSCADIKADLESIALSAYDAYYPIGTAP